MTTKDITNGTELLEALTCAVRRAGFKEFEDLLAGKTNTRYERIREELANVCRVAGLDMEAEREAHEETRRKLERLRLAADRYVEAREEYARTESSHDWTVVVSATTEVRHHIDAARPPINLARVAASAAVNAVRSGGEYAAEFAKAAKVRP